MARFHPSLAFLILSSFAPAIPAKGTFQSAGPRSSGRFDLASLRQIAPHIVVVPD